MRRRRTYVVVVVVSTTLKNHRRIFHDEECIAICTCHHRSSTGATFSCVAVADGVGRTRVPAAVSVQDAHVLPLRIEHLGVVDEAALLVAGAGVLLLLRELAGRFLLVGL